MLLFLFFALLVTHFHSLMSVFAITLFVIISLIPSFIPYLWCHLYFKSIRFPCYPLLILFLAARLVSCLIFIFVLVVVSVISSVIVPCYVSSVVCFPFAFVLFLLSKLMAPLLCSIIVISVSSLCFNDFSSLLFSDWHWSGCLRSLYTF